MRKRVLLVSDVKNWGGYERAEYIKKHLSDEFDFDLMDGDQFRHFEEHSDSGFIKFDDIMEIRKRDRNQFTKNWISIDRIKARKKETKDMDRPYDLYYFMFHTMLCWQEVKRIQHTGGKILSAVTGFPVIKKVFENEKMDGNSKDSFLRLANNSAGLSVNNKKAERELRKIYNGKIWYTPRGVDEEFFYRYNYKLWDKPPKDEFEEDVKFTAGFVGKDRSGKGLNRFIKPACQESGTKLITNERNYTNALPKSAMRDMYNNIHVYIVASSTDGTPNPALEAAACGRPIIANAIGNMPEFIIDGYNGFLVDTGGEGKAQNFTKYKEKLQWMKDHPQETKIMGVNARKTVLKEWTWQHNLEYERTAIREALNENSG
jgi:glycosyltransferase involved in cell wall biosynthesis